MNFLGKDRELILVYNSMDRVDMSDSVSIMLTPQFYTLKKEILPVKYEYQAKKIAPAIFDGLLSYGKSYEYLVYKEKDEAEWTLIAYDIDMISSFLLSKGFVLEKISKIFFAQQVVSMLDNPLYIGESEALVSLEGSVVVVPSLVLSEDEKQYLKFDNSFTPNRGVGIKSASNSLITTKQSIILSSIFVAFAIMLFVEGLEYSNTNQAKAKMQELFAEYPSLESSYTRDSIIKKYKKLDKSERNKRDIVKKISTMIFNGVSLGSLDIDDKGFKVRLVCKDAKVAKNIVELSSKEGFKTLNIAGSNDVLVEGSL